MSIRSTNVYVLYRHIVLLVSDTCPYSYEERSLGVFEEPADDEDEEPNDLTTLEPRQRIGRYVGWHLRRQLSIGELPSISMCVHIFIVILILADIWWLVWGVFLVAIVERNNLLDQDKKWFDLFRILFELVSAFGGIGLSLGFPSVRLLTLLGTYPLTPFCRIISHSQEL